MYFLTDKKCFCISMGDGGLLFLDASSLEESEEWVRCLNAVLYAKGIAGGMYICTYICTYVHMFVLCMWGFYEVCMFLTINKSQYIPTYIIMYVAGVYVHTCAYVCVLCGRV